MRTGNIDGLATRSYGGPCITRGGISRSAGVAAALSYIITQDDTWVFIAPRYLPNRLVYRTILDIYYRDHPHPPYHRLEGHGYIYWGSVIYDRPYDLYLYQCAGEEPMFIARYGQVQYDVIIGGPNRDDHPAMRELRRRVDTSGLLDLAPFYISYRWATTIVGCLGNAVDDLLFRTVPHGPIGPPVKHEKFTSALALNLEP